MKLLLDQGLPLSAAALLCEAGIDTIHVSEIEMFEAEDAEIIFVVCRWCLMSNLFRQKEVLFNLSFSIGSWRSP